MTEPNVTTIDSMKVYYKARVLKRNPLTLGLASYAAYLIVKEGKGYKAAVNEGCKDKELRAFLLENQSELEPVAEAMSEFEAEELSNFVLSDAYVELPARFGGDYSTPHCVTELAIRVLDIHDGDRVADLCCGIGRFLANVACFFESRVYGFDIDTRAVMMAKATLALIDADGGNVVAGDVLSGGAAGSYDKVLSNFPFGVRVPRLAGEGKYYEIARAGKEGFGRPASADWLFALAAYDSLAEGGRALAVMTSGAMFNGGDKQARRYFVDNGMIQAVITLPGGLFQGIGIQTTALVLGKNDGPIRMVDATDLSVPGRRWDSMGEDEIVEILRLLEEDSDDSRSIGYDELEQREFSLAPARYLGRAVELVNPTAISKIALSIERGAGYRASELDEMATQEDTDCSYLRLSNISDGIIGDDLAHLSDLDPKTEKQWLRTGDLVISKNGAPFKVAVADIPEGKKVLVNGNLYIIRLDPEKADPYYVAAFLASDDGKEVMSREVVGTSIPNLPQANLKRMQIALPPLDEQRRIGELYRARLDEIEMLRIKLEKARISATETYVEAVAR